MKKLICVLSVLFMLIPAAYGEDVQDPIVGCWYADMEMGGEIVLNGYEDYTRFLVVLSFEATGEITRFEIDYNGAVPDVSGPSTVGKWKRDKEGEYTLSVLAAGKEKAYIVDGNLYAIAIAKDIYFCFHKMIPFDWYEDMYTK